MDAFTELPTYDEIVKTTWYSEYLMTLRWSGIVCLEHSLKLLNFARNLEIDKSDSIHIL